MAESCLDLKRQVKGHTTQLASNDTDRQSLHENHNQLKSDFDNYVKSQELERQRELLNDKQQNQPPAVEHESLERLQVKFTFTVTQIKQRNYDRFMNSLCIFVTRSFTRLVSRDQSNCSISPVIILCRTNCTERYAQGRRIIFVLVEHQLDTYSRIVLSSNFRKISNRLLLSEYLLYQYRNWILFRFL